jgi:predicted dehydrogenase
MKILIAGLGSIGRRHLKNLVTLGERDILLYHTGRGTLPDDELAGFPVETDLAAALDHRPDAVIVANPTALHLEVAIPAAERGCHLLLEKPVSHSMEEVERLQEALRRGGGHTLVGFQFRFHPGLQKIKELLTSSITSHPSPHPPLSNLESRVSPPLGRPLSARAHWGEYLPGWHPWEDYRQGYSARRDLGGGVILTLCHPLDYLRWLFGEVEALWAFAGRLGDLDLDVEDTAEIGLRYQSGMLGSVHLDYNQRPSAHTLEVVGTEGVIRWDNADMPPGFERNDLFLAEMRHFLAVARGEATPLCTLEDGIQALRLALAAQRSVETGKISILE